MMISEEKMKIVIDNYFKSECDVNTSIRQAFERGFRIGARKAQSAEPEWILCTPETMPEENMPVLVGVRFKDDFKMFVTARMDYNYWTGLGRDIKGEMRWMPLPEPYHPKEDA